jgi:hypothetical protein
VILKRACARPGERGQWRVEGCTDGERIAILSGDKISVKTLAR